MPSNSDPVAARRVMTLPVDSTARKKVPLYRGLFRYFPAALCAVAEISQVGGDKHCGGELYHDRSKSGDHLDCELRHLIDLAENEGLEVGTDRAQLAYNAWRALAALQKWEEEHGAPIAPAARNADQEPSLFDGGVPAGVKS